MVKYSIYIEGTDDLKIGFQTLFAKTGINFQPRITMGKGINQTVKKFKNHEKEKDRANYKKLLLIDSDCPHSEKDKVIKTHGLEDDNKNNRIFFMVQAMEAWFISQKNKVSELYGNDAIKSLPGTPAHEISKPKQEFAMAFKKCGKYYKEVKHGAEILQTLDAKSLMKDFSDVEKLITELSKS